MDDTSGEHLQWTQLYERDELAGWLTVISRRYRYPDGTQGDWDILRGGKTTAIVALTDDDQALLVRQFRPGPARVLLELPGGMVDDNESVEQAAARELLEETGYEAGSLEIVMQTYLSAFAMHQRYAALARNCRRVTEPNPDSGEFLEVVTLPISEFIQHILTGQLTDTDMAFAGLTAAGFLKPTD